MLGEHGRDRTPHSVIVGGDVAGAMMTATAQRTQDAQLIALESENELMHTFWKGYLLRLFVIFDPILARVASGVGVQLSKWKKAKHLRKVCECVYVAYHVIIIIPW